MRTQNWVLASAFALVASVACAEPERPRIYYPRAVKRQIANITTDDLPEPASTTTLDSTTRRGLLDELLDDVINADRTSSDDARATPSDRTDRETTTDGGIIVGPTGIRIPALESRPTDSSTRTDSDNSTPTGTPKESTTSKDSTSDSDSSASSRPSTTTSSTKLIDLDPILSSLLPDPTSANITSTDSTATATSTSASESSSSGGLIDLSSLLPVISETSTSSSEATTSTDSASLTSSSDIPVTPTPVPSETNSDVLTNTSGLPNETSSTELPSTPLTPVPSTSIEPTDVPVTNTTEPTGSTELPSASETSVIAPPPTPSSDLPGFTTPGPEPTTLSTVAPSQPVSSSEAQPTSTEKNEDNWLPTTIVQAPTSFSFSRPTAEPTGTATAIPSNVPKVILPDEPDVQQPEGTTPIQIGFLYPLNWGFVSKSGVAAAQVFKWLPDALAYAGEFPPSNVVVTKLVPLDTTAKWGYITTIAKVYYPTDQLPGLQMQLNVANSRLYNNPVDIVNSLSANINRNIDLFGNIEEENGGANSGNNDNGNGSDDTFSDNDTGNTTAQERARTAGIAVGALSLAGLYGAAMFIVARRYKRKRQGHQRTSSLTSSQASSEMRYTGAGSPALMGGALLSRDVSSYGGYAVGGRDSHGSGQSGSARTANISAPVATENSLGWN